MNRLVVVEDDDPVRKSMGLYFRRAGWTVDLATDVEQAAQCFATPFDVMICDLHLSPRRAAEGLGVLATARRLAPAAILVLLSGDATVDFGGVVPDAVLQKPVRLAHLAELLTHLLQQRA